MEKDLSSWTKPQLQAQLRKLKLKVSGNKPDLIQRIQSAERVDSKSTYATMLVKELKELLRSRKLSLTGNKDVLISRLETSDTKKISSGRKSSTKRPSPKRTPQQYISEIPDEILLEVLQNLNDTDLANTCRTDKRAAQICKDNTFWKNRIKLVFDINLNIHKYDDVTYEKLYKFLKKVTDEKRYKLLKKYGGSAVGHILNKAMRLGYLPILRHILEDLQYDIHANNEFALLQAVEAGKTEVVKYLVKQGAKISALDRKFQDTAERMVR